MLNSVVFVILWIKILGVCALCNVIKPFALSAIFRHVTPQRAKHKGPLSRLTKHYVTYSKEQYTEINVILHYEEHFTKTWKPAKITRKLEEGKGNTRQN